LQNFALFDNADLSEVRSIWQLVTFALPFFNPHNQLARITTPTPSTFDFKMQALKPSSSNVQQQAKIGPAPISKGL